MKEGDKLIAAVAKHRELLEGHDCGECLDSFAALLIAITEWVNKKDEEVFPKFGG